MLRGYQTPHRGGCGHLVQKVYFLTLNGGERLRPHFPLVLLVIAGSPEDLECDPTGMGGVAASLQTGVGHAGEAREGGSARRCLPC